ncbi:hypothetical protein WR25_12429 [Diploscapter pachys]|uniref:Uncharacterized protein n=1 Tax=Diploscapter pachys TaxID=2018661 RepID=A0A2A2LMN8_9BILA|nr:hypothetical protein WR25_12429 [Diploscapter pachys]
MITSYIKERFRRFSKRTREKFAEDTMNILNQINFLIHYILLKLSLTLFFYPNPGTRFYADRFGRIFWAYIITFLYSILMIVSLKSKSLMLYMVTMTIYVFLKCFMVCYVLFNFFMVLFEEYNGSLTNLLSSTVGVSSISASVTVVTIITLFFFMTIRMANRIILSGYSMILKANQEKEQIAENGEGNQGMAVRLI